MLSIGGRRAGRIARAAKRTLDVVVSATALVLLSPVMAAVAIAIRMGDGKPVLFRQTRVGQWGRPFEVVKFRTMVQGAERLQASELIAAGPEAIADLAETIKYRSDEWITPVGHFLRRTSLDELPQFWNVLKGEMSLVGPRPAAALRGRGPHRVAARPPGGPPRHHRALADPRPQRDRVGRADAARLLIRAALDLPARPRDHRAHGRRGAEPSGSGLRTSGAHERPGRAAWKVASRQPSR